MTTALPDGFVWTSRPSDLATVEDLAAAWLAHANAIYARYPENYESLSDEELDALELGPNPADNTDNWEAVHTLSHEHPDHTLLFIRCVLDARPRALVVAYLAAGPLEVVLGFHGPAVIDRVESWAREDPFFKSCLACVWQYFMPDEIWFRVCRATSRPEISMNDPEDDL